MRDFVEKLCSVERDRATAAEICIDELLTMMDRHDMDGAAYNMLVNLSAELHSALSEVDGPSKTRERLMRVRAGLTNAFPMTDEDLGAGAAPAQ
jgi:hypothetical protein